MTQSNIFGMYDNRGKYIPSQKEYMCGKYKDKSKKSKHIKIQLYPCYFDGCKKPSTYGYIDDMKKISCIEHKKENMKSLKGYFCHCKKRASYNFKGLQAKYCKKHSQDGMILVNVRRCGHKGCDTIPTFNYPNKRTCIRCYAHKLDGMINIKKS